MKSDLYSQIDRNKRKTFLIMLGFVVFITALSLFLTYAFVGQEAVYFFIPLAVIVSLGSTVFSFYNSDKIVIATSRAKPADPVQFEQLHVMVGNISKVAQIPKPRVYLIDDTATNAFATGRDPKHGAVVFTTGLLQKLEKPELEGVIAHEIAHIRNYDTRLMAVVAVLIGFVVILSDWFLRVNVFKSRENKSGIIVLIAMLLAILAPISLELVKFAISRNREYLADATGAYFTRYPKGLADALVKISSDSEKLEAANRGTAHLYISDPFKRKAASLFSTHPPIQERISRLNAM